MVFIVDTIPGWPTRSPRLLAEVLPGAADAGLVGAVGARAAGGGGGALLEPGVGPPLGGPEHSLANLFRVVGIQR